MFFFNFRYLLIYLVFLPCESSINLQLIMAPPFLSAFLYTINYKHTLMTNLKETSLSFIFHEKTFSLLFIFLSLGVLQPMESFTIYFRWHQTRMFWEMANLRVLEIGTLGIFLRSFFQICIQLINNLIIFIFLWANSEILFR